MIPEEQAFLTAIRAAWTDRAARLAYADWLEERGDPRAELVRVCEEMRQVPVFADRYWKLKARRNELWVRFPLDWLQATGYDGSYYDPIFRDGVPDDWKGRWRLIREFTERWYGVAVPDVGGWRRKIVAVERRLKVKLPPSAQEFVAFAHDFYDMNDPWSHKPRAELFHSAVPEFIYLRSDQAISLIYYSIVSSWLGVAQDNLANPDPPTFNYYERRSNEVEQDDSAGPMTSGQRTPEPYEPSLSLAIFHRLLPEIPAAGLLNTTILNPVLPEILAAVSLDTTLLNLDDFLSRLTVDFPIHTRFDDANIYESDEMFAAVFGRRGRYNEHDVQVIIRRPIPSETVPDYLIMPDDPDTISRGMLQPSRRQVAEVTGWAGGIPLCRWVSPIARQLAPPPPPTRSPSSLPDGDDDIPF